MLVAYIIFLMNPFPFGVGYIPVNLSSRLCFFHFKIFILCKCFNYSLYMVFFLYTLLSSHPNQGPWKVTLNTHVYSKFLEYCPDRDMRWNVWQAYTRRASKYADPNLENSTHLEELRYLR